MRFNRFSVFYIVYALIWIPLLIWLYTQSQSYEIFSIEWNRNRFLSTIVQGAGYIILGIAIYLINKQQRWASAVWLVLGIIMLYFAGSFAYKWMGGRYYQPNLLAGWHTYKGIDYVYAVPPTWNFNPYPPSYTGFSTMDTQLPDSSAIDPYVKPEATGLDGQFRVWRYTDGRTKCERV